MAFVLGCEWEKSGDDDSWSDSMASWVNFAGTYRASDGGTLVRTTFGTGGVATVTVSSESIGTGNNGSTYGGSLANSPIVEGTLLITATGYGFRDDNNGALVDSGNPSVSGSVVYQTGGWSINLAGNILGVGEAITASYSYSSGGSSSSSDSSSDDIYSITIDQTGNRLTAIDSTGRTYSGEISGVAQSGGDTSGATEGTVTANFSMTGSDGATIVGVFAGYYTPASTDDDSAAGSTGALVGRQIEGNYINASGVTGDMLGTTSDITTTTN